MLAVHPRVRGEHGADVTCTVDDGGSSPRARGTRLAPLVPILFLRFIPACAGNTPQGDTVPASSPVHPRVRGEHEHRAICRLLRPGSSPRARGTPYGWR